jgi:AbrB family looped-hinge helix DNA binding protein
MAEVVKVTTKGQLTLPARIRRDLDISEDTYLLAEEVGDFVVLRRVETRFLELSESFRKEAKRKGITRKALLRALKGARRRRTGGRGRSKGTSRDAKVARTKEEKIG